MKTACLVLTCVVLSFALAGPPPVRAQPAEEGLRSRLELFDAFNPAATFKVRVRAVNDQYFFRLGEEAVFELESDLDAHVIVLTRDAAGSVVQLWPNQWSPEARLRKGVPTRLPAGPDAGFKIKAQAPPGFTIVKAIASRRALALDGVGTRGFPEVPEKTRGFVLEGDPAKKPRRPSDLPSEDWATAEALFYVVADGAAPRPVTPPSRPPAEQPGTPPRPARPLPPDRSANEKHWQEWLRVREELRAGRLRANADWGASRARSIAEEDMESAQEIVVVRRARGGVRGAGDDYLEEVVPVPVQRGGKVDQGALRAEIERLLKEPDVITAFPNYKLRQLADNSNVRLWNLHYHLTNSHAAGMDIGWTQLPAEARRVRVPLIGVVDEGPDIRDPRLAGCFARNSGEIPDNGLDDDNNGYEDDVIGWHFLTRSPALPGIVGDSNHGSFVSSIIAGRPVGLVRDVQGIVPYAQVVPAGVFSGTNKPSDLDVIKAVRYCRARGARVINLSLGRYCSRLDLALIARHELWGQLEAAGVIVVCAAGNEGRDTDDFEHFPSGLSRRYSNVISVMASDVGGDRGRFKDTNGVWQYFSNHGARSVTLAAPGTEVVGVPQPNKITIDTGTSFSAPQVTAAVALLMGLHPEWDHRTVIRALVETSTPLEALQGRCVSGGIINLPRAAAFKP
jgi:hypothetical protein